MLTPNSSGIPIAAGFLLGLLLMTQHALNPVLGFVVDSDRAVLKRAEVWNDSKDYEKAEPLFHRYLKSHPSNAFATAELAYCLNGEENFSAALIEADKSLALDPNCTMALSNKAWALTHLNRYREALAVAESDLDKHPDNGESWCTKGEALMRLQRYDEALVALKKHKEFHGAEEYSENLLAELNNLKKAH